MCEKSVKHLEVFMTVKVTAHCSTCWVLFINVIIKHWPTLAVKWSNCEQPPFLNQIYTSLHLKNCKNPVSSALWLFIQMYGAYFVFTLGERAASISFPIWKVCAWSSSNMLTMFVVIITRTSSISSQIPPGVPEFWPLNW